MAFRSVPVGDRPIPLPVSRAEILRLALFWSAALAIVVAATFALVAVAGFVIAGGFEPPTSAL